MRPFLRLLSTALAVLLVLGPASTALASAALYQTRGLSFSGMNGLMSGSYSPGGSVNVGFVSQTTDGGRTWTASAVTQKPYIRGIGAWGTGGWMVSEYNSRPFNITPGAVGPVATLSSGTVPGTEYNSGLQGAAVLDEGKRVAVIGERDDPTYGRLALIATSDDDGANWATAFAGPEQPWMDESKARPKTSAEMTAIDSRLNGSVAWAVGNEFNSGWDSGSTLKQHLVFRSIDSGASWSFASNISTKTVDGTAGNRLLDVAAVSGTTAFATGLGRTLVWTTDGGATWEGGSPHIPRDFTANNRGVSNVQARSVDALDSNRVLVAAENGKIAWSSNARSNVAADWKFFTIAEKPLLTQAKMLSSTEWIVVGNDETIYRTTNGGQTWTGTSGRKAPNVAIASPTGSSTLSEQVVSITGTSDDQHLAGQSGAGVTKVEIAVSRQDGKFWHGSSWESGQKWFSATTADQWKTWAYDWDLGPSVGVDTYTLTARATDAVGQSKQSSVAGVKVVNAGMVSGTITDIGSGTPLEGVSVRVSGVDPVITASNGAYQLSVPAGTHELVLSKPGYDEKSAFVTVTTGQTTIHNNALVETFVPTTGEITGRVTDRFGSLAGVSVKVGSVAMQTDSLGEYAIREIEPGTYEVEYSKSGYVTQKYTEDISAGGQIIRNPKMAATTGVLDGTVIVGDQLLAGASVKVGSMATVLTNQAGAYSIPKIAPGKHSVTYSYSGHVTQKFDIVVEADKTVTRDIVMVPIPPDVVLDRAAGANRFSGSAAIARKTYDTNPLQTGTQWGYVRNIVIASGEDRGAADPLAAAGLCGALEAPLLLVSRAGVDSEVKKVVNEIAAAASGNVTVHIVGGPASVPDSTYNELVSAVSSSHRAKLKKNRLLDKGDRYDMAAKIAQEVKRLSGNTPSTVLIANGADPSKFSDALALSPISANQAFPILLVAGDSVPAATKKVLDEFKPRNIIVGGGTATVSSSVYTQLKATERWSGANRYLTAIDVANKAIAKNWASPKNVGVAAALPDALTGGSAVGFRGGVLLLTDGKTLTSQTGTWAHNNRAGMETCTLFGGPVVLSESVRTALASRLKQ